MQHTGRPQGTNEMHRVLKPEGDLIFVEHGLAPESKESLAKPVDSSVESGCRSCNINRKIDSLIQAAGFALFELENHYLPVPKMFNSTYRGRAQKL